MQLSQILPPRRPSRTTAVFATAGLLVVLMACGHLLHGNVPSPDIDLAKASAHGLYRATVRPDVVPIATRRLQSWTLHIDTVDGRPVDTATITMSGGMPQHGHGLPTSPRVTPKSPTTGRSSRRQARAPSPCGNYSATRRGWSPSSRR